MEIKKKKCKECSQMFTPYTTTQMACSYKCEMSLKSKKAAERKVSKVEKAKNEYSTWMRSAVTVCHSYIRLRDKGKPCISCGKKFNNNFQAGHYFSGGGHKAVKFDEVNINGQCFECNSGSNFDHEAYANGIVERWGSDEMVCLLERAYDEKRWSKEELRSVVSYYKEKIKNMINDERHL